MIHNYSGSFSPFGLARADLFANKSTDVVACPTMVLGDAVSDNTVSDTTSPIKASQMMAGKSLAAFKASEHLHLMSNTF